MPGLRSETYGTGDQTWLGSTHGIYNCRSGNLDLSAFTEATHYPDGFLRSGLPLGRLTASGKFAPYNAAASTGAETLAGFLYTDQPVIGDEDINAPVLMHGVINVDRLPVDFTPPADSGAFVFVGSEV